MERPTAATLNDRIALRSISHKRQMEVTVTSSCQSVNYLLEAYATYSFIAETNADMIFLRNHLISRPWNTQKL